MLSRIQEHALRRDQSVSPQPGPRQKGTSPPAPRPKDIGPAAEGTFKIPVGMIPLLLGPKGATIREIERTSGTRVDVDKSDGTVRISSADTAAVRRARELIEDLMKEKPMPVPVVPAVLPEVEVGATYQATVVSIKDFGCFVRLPSGREVLVHISELDPRRVDRVEDVVKIRDVIMVKCIGKDMEGRARMSRKAVMQERGGGHAARMMSRDSGRRA